VSRHPFIDRLNDYLSSAGIDDTAARHLRNIARIFAALKEDGRIQSENPSRIVPNDISQFVSYRSEGGASSATIRRDLRYLDGFLSFCNNDSVTVYLDDLRSKEKEIIESEGVSLAQSILHRSGKVSGMDPLRQKAYSFVIVSMVFGLRPEQVRKTFLIRDFSPGQLSSLFIQYQDGSSSKCVKLDPRALPILDGYIDSLAVMGRHAFAQKQPLFPSSDPLFTFISPEESRSLKRIVEKDLGATFDYRMLQKAYRIMSTVDVDPSTIVKENVSTVKDTYTDTRAFGKLKDVLFRRALRDSSSSF
jgi:hypothetical protein